MKRLNFNGFIFCLCPNHLGGCYKKHSKGELQFKPKLPKYRKGKGCEIVTYPKQALKLVDNNIKIPLGNTVKRWFKLDSFLLPMPSNLKADIKELRILPRNQCFYAEVYQQKSAPKLDLNLEYALAEDFLQKMVC